MAYPLMKADLSTTVRFAPATRRGAATETRVERARRETRVAAEREVRDNMLVRVRCGGEGVCLRADGGRERRRLSPSSGLS